MKVFIGSQEFSGDLVGKWWWKWWCLWCGSTGGEDESREEHMRENKTKKKKKKKWKERKAESEPAKEEIRWSDCVVGSGVRWGTWESKNLILTFFLIIYLFYFFKLTGCYSKSTSFLIWTQKTNSSTLRKLKPIPNPTCSSFKVQDSLRAWRIIGCEEGKGLEATVSTSIVTGWSLDYNLVSNSLNLTSEPTLPSRDISHKKW